MIDKNYLLSNKITAVKIQATISMVDLTKYLLQVTNFSDRQRLGEQLLDELCDAARIDIVNLKISDTNQYHKKSGGKVVFKQYGYYRPKSCYIYIQNKTAVRGQDLAPKTFLDTLLHEWVHHYDTCKLKLNSIHTKGFYDRLNDLKAKLGIV
ncbi:MAG: hypothetical protein JW816_01735 [Candidatus Buchananbacteria bacterium]|nr:hypothetical protein [Candidatus Buchananbacteria bacterium]